MVKRAREEEDGSFRQPKVPKVEQDGRVCALDTVDAAAVFCQECGEAYCRTCDAAVHKHPSRRGHLFRVPLALPTRVEEDELKGGKVFQDVVYGYVRVTPIALRFIDTPAFQRLKEIKQLSVVHHVYKSARHSRFDHSLGVYHLAGVFMNTLRDNEPSEGPEAGILQMSDWLIELVKLAGLLHDIGHVAFSHTFDHGIGKIMGLGEHEDRSEELVRYLVKEEGIPLTDKEVGLICAIIGGRESYMDYPKYLFQIVANHTNQVDVDKLDYLQRDSLFTGIPLGFQPMYLIMQARVIGDQVCYSEKAAITLYDMFHARFRMHKEIYRHKTVVIIEAMLNDAIILAAPQLNLQDKFSTVTEWLKVTDERLLTWIKDAPSSPELDRAKEILERIERRQLYHTIEEKVATITGSTPAKKMQTSFDVSSPTVVVDSIIGYTSSKKGINPVDHIRFYKKQKDPMLPTDTRLLQATEISALLPVAYAERQVMVMSRVLRKKTRVPRSPAGKANAGNGNPSS